MGQATSKSLTRLCNFASGNELSSHTTSDALSKGTIVVRVSRRVADKIVRRVAAWAFAKPANENRKGKLISISFATILNSANNNRTKREAPQF